MASSEAFKYFIMASIIVHGGIDDGRREREC